MSSYPLHLDSCRRMFGELVTARSARTLSVPLFEGTIEVLQVWKTLSVLRETIFDKLTVQAHVSNHLENIKNYSSKSPEERKEIGGAKEQEEVIESKASKGCHWAILINVAFWQFIKGITDNDVMNVFRVVIIPFYILHDNVWRIGCHPYSVHSTIYRGTEVLKVCVAGNNFWQPHCSLLKAHEMNNLENIQYYSRKSPEERKEIGWVKSKKRKLKAKLQKAANEWSWLILA